MSVRQQAAHIACVCQPAVQALTPCSWTTTTSSPWYGTRDATSQKVDHTGSWNKTAAAAASSATKQRAVSISKLTFYYNKTSECLDGIKLTYGDGKGRLLGRNATSLVKQEMLLVNGESVVRATLVTVPR